MRLRFRSCDFPAYIGVRDALLDELAEWLDRPGPERAEIVTDTKVFVDWRYHDSSGRLDEFVLRDISEFLLEWCPRRLKRPADSADSLCGAVGVYVDFMAATGRLIGGTDHADRLKRLAADLAPTVRAELSSPDSGAKADPYRLPFLYFPPSATDTATAAAAAPLLSKINALRGYVASNGKPLTDNGHLEVSDGRALVDLLDTGDEVDPRLGDLKIELKSTLALRRLNFILDCALEVGAVAVRQHRLVRGQTWDTRPAVAQAAALFAAIVKLGPLQSISYGSDEVLAFLDDGIAHWLVALLARQGAELPFESLVEWVQPFARRRPHSYWSDEGLDEDSIEEEIALLLTVLEEAGVVRWAGRQEVDRLYLSSCWTGGAVGLTALGRHVVPDYLDQAGYLLRRIDRIAEWDAAALIAAMLLVDKNTYPPLVANWRADRPLAERVQMLTEAIVATPSAAGRVAGFAALNEFDIEVTEPWVRQLLDTPVSGHAALWLVSRQRADAKTLAGFVDTAVFVDALASKIDEPAVLCSFFTGPEPMRLIEDMWNHPAVETAAVLDALGRHLPDRELAKAARRAAVRHRSWMANRQRLAG